MQAVQLAGPSARLGLLDQRVQFSGTGVGGSFLVPKRFAILFQPVRNRMNFLGF